MPKLTLLLPLALVPRSVTALRPLRPAQVTEAAAGLCVELWREASWPCVVITPEGAVSLARVPLLFIFFSLSLAVLLPVLFPSRGWRF